MQLSDVGAWTLFATVAGTILGFLLSLYSQNRSLKLQEKRETRKEVYAPLRDELTRDVNQLTVSESPDTKEWLRIKESHLTYLIDSELERKLEHYYGTTLSTLGDKFSDSMTHFGALITTDLQSRANSKVGEIQQLANPIWWGIMRGYLTQYELTNYSSTFDVLKGLQGSKIEGAITNYLEYWKNKSIDDPILIEYHATRKSALQEAEGLRTIIARKLGKPMAIAIGDKS